MYEKLLDYFLTEPGRLVGAGRLAARSGLLLLFIGLCGRVATTGVAVLLSRVPGAMQATALADVYPALPTWWVPETAFGFVLCVVLIASGIAAAQTGKKLQLYLNH
jgi:hypothetical protein